MDIVHVVLHIGPQEVGVVAETTQYGRGIHFMLNDYGSTMDSFTFFSCSADTEVTGVERKCSVRTIQWRDIGLVLFQCWPSVCDAGPALKQYMANVSRWLTLRLYQK